MSALDLLLVAAVASYSPPEPKAKVEPKAPKAPKVAKEPSEKRPVGRPRKTPEVKETGSETTTAQASTDPLAGIVPGSLSPADFLQVLLKAGKGNLTENWDKIRALHGFLLEGYQQNIPLGVQLSMAELRAKTMIRGTFHDKPKPSLSVAGYTSGLPDNRNKKIADLEGRIALALDTKREALARAGDKTLSIAERKAAAASSGVEVARLKNLNLQLKELLG